MPDPDRNARLIRRTYRDYTNVVGYEMDAMYHLILIPTDGSELSEKAIRHGVVLAKAHEAKVTALHVTAPFHVSALDPITVVQQAQEEHMQARALASRHLQSLPTLPRRLELGTETVKVLAHTIIPVLVVR